MLEGRLVLDTAEGSVALGPGDYGFVPVGVAHAARNPGPEPARWADMLAPQPRARFGDDTFFVPPLAAADPVPVDVRDPRTRSFGHIDPANMDPGRQTQDQLAVSASMRTALLVYSGITVKMMVDSDLGAQLQTMFMVQYEPGGPAPTTTRWRRPTWWWRARSTPASTATPPPAAGRRRLGRGRLRPRLLQPGRPAGALAGDPGPAAAGPPLLPVHPRLGLPARRARLKGPSHAGAGIGRRGRRDLGAGPRGGPPLRLPGPRGRAVRPRPAAGRGGRRRPGRHGQGIALDLAEPGALADRLAGVERVGHLVLAAIERDENKVRSFDLEGATRLATLKLVGYAETIHQLAPRMDPEGLGGAVRGRAKDRPYPGSTMVSTVNGGVTGLVHSLAVELAPVRCNAIHPGIVGDSPYWSAKGEPALEPVRNRTPSRRLVTMEDIVGAVVFLLENRSVNGENLHVDGGWLLL